MLVNAKKLFADALKNNYAVGAFNFVNYEMLKPILETAQKNNSPVIIQSSVGAIKYAGIAVLSGMVKALAQPLSVSVVWNLDHGKTFEDCKLAVDNGMTNVMIDASSLPYEENIALTKKVVDYAHSHGVTVEAELGTLQGIEDEVSVSGDHAFYTDPGQAKDFITRTGVDSLAVAIGTSHGAYKFKGSGSLRLDILSEIEQQIPTIPLVLHGASSIPADVVALATRYGARLEGASGVPENLLEKACTEHHICKVNVDSDLRISFQAGLREHLFLHPENIDVRATMENAMAKIANTIDFKLNHVFHSTNQSH